MPKVDFGFDVATVRPPEGAETPVARVFTKYIYPNELMASSPSLDKEGSRRLQGLIMHALMERFAEKERIVASDEEVDHFNRTLLSGAGNVPGSKIESEAPEAKAARTELGAAFVRQWKIDKRLYELYGGAVIFQQGNPQEPVGAYRGLMEDMERSKVIEIYDKNNRDRVWEYFTRDHGPWKVPADKIDYSKPWWLRTPGQ